MKRPDLDAPASEWLVYGDALQLAGDPAGELIGLVHAISEGRAEASVRDAYVRKHWSSLLGKAPPHTDAYEFEWHYCTLGRVTIRVRPNQEDPVGPLLDAPVAKDLRAIMLVGAPDRVTIDLAPAMEKLVERAPSSCTSFAFVDERAAKASMLVSRDFDPGENLVKFGPFGSFFARAKSISIDCADSQQLEFNGFRAPDLESFALRSLRFADWEDMQTMADRLNEATFSKLASFELRGVEQWMANTPNEVNPYVPVYTAEDWDGGEDADDGENEGVSWTALNALFATLSKCPLTRLAITSVESASSLVTALASTTWPTVTELDLSDSGFTDEHANTLPSALGKAFPALSRIVVERTRITDRGAQALRAAGWTVAHSTSETAPSWRYVVGAE